MDNKPIIIYNPNTFDLFADTCAGVSTVNGTMKITLDSIRTNYSVEPNQREHVILGRIVMPIHQAKHMANLILKMIEKLDTNQNVIQNVGTTSVQ